MVANTPAQIVEGIQEIVRLIWTKCPRAKIILMGIFPRNGRNHVHFLPFIACLNMYKNCMVGDFGNDIFKTNELLNEFVHTRNTTKLRFLDLSKCIFKCLSYC